MSARRVVLALLGLAILLLPGRAAAEEWRSEQPVPAGLGAPAAIGPVGDVEFWAPNRGLLITAGNGGNPAGLFAYDGTGWHRYSTVCGGAGGRIAWAGPTEFWTISDQPNGQATGKAPPAHISLCHFEGGQVVASYAEPLGVAGSYLPMNAAACNGPSDCWFAGERLPGTTNVGAFHLHWDGTTLSPVPSLTEPQPQIVDPGRSVWSLAFSGGNLYESVAVREGDIAPQEPEGEPSLFHRIVAGAVDPFEPLAGAQPAFGGGAGAAEMQPFHLTGAGGSLWAVAGSESERGGLTVVRLVGGNFEQLPLLDPEGFFQEGDHLGGAALEPGGEAAWVGFSRLEDEFPPAARLARVHADGSIEAPVLLPAEIEGLARKGTAGPIACPGTEQCWMATSEGWLFHLGPSLSQDTDPAMHALIEFRPPDNSLPSIPPTSLPEDNSGSESKKAEGEEELPEALFPENPKGKALLGKVKQRLVGHVLELSFVLRARAHVQLIGRRKGRVVAKTPRYTLGTGKHKIHLRLDPKRWPTKLDLEVHRAKGGRK